MRPVVKILWPLVEFAFASCSHIIVVEVELIALAVWSPVTSSQNILKVENVRRQCLENQATKIHGYYR